MVDVNLRVPALEKLVDYSASGIGAVAGPMLAPWKARKEAEARLIESKAEADSLKLIADAQAEARNSLAAPDEAGRGVLEIDHDGIRQRIEFQERKRQANIASVVREAAAELGDKEVPDHEPDPDWTARFFEGVQDVSTQELQRIWSKILAGAVETPGRTSLHTLSILKNMSQHDARMYSGFSRYAIGGFIHNESYFAMLNSIPHYVVIAMKEVGLVHGSSDVYLRITLDVNGTKAMQHCRDLLVLEGESGKEFDLHGNFLTRSGKELAQFCENDSDLEYLKHFSQFLMGHGCTLKRAPIIRIDSEGKPWCDRNDLRVVEPAP